MKTVLRVGAILIAGVHLSAAAAGLGPQSSQSSLYTFGPGAQGRLGQHGGSPGPAPGNIGPDASYYRGPPPDQPPANFRRQNQNGRLRIDARPSIRYERRMRQLYEPSYGFSLYHGYRSLYGTGGVRPEDRPPAPESIRQ